MSESKLKTEQLVRKIERFSRGMIDESKIDKNLPEPTNNEAQQFEIYTDFILILSQPHDLTVEQIRNLSNSIKSLVINAKYSRWYA